MKFIAKQKLTTVILSCAFILAISCATIMHGTSQKIGVSSNPTGAKVTVDNKDMGVTPIFANLSRGDNHIVKIQLEGYQIAELTVTKKVSGWVWGNVLFGGLIGLAVDAISGGLYVLTPEQINAELKKSDIDIAVSDNCLFIITVLSPDQKWQKVGLLIKTNNERY